MASEPRIVYFKAGEEPVLPPAAAGYFWVLRKPYTDQEGVAKIYWYEEELLPAKKCRVC